MGSEGGGNATRPAVCFYWSALCRFGLNALWSGAQVHQTHRVFGGICYLGPLPFTVFSCHNLISRAISPPDFNLPNLPLNLNRNLPPTEITSQPQPSASGTLNMGGRAHKNWMAARLRQHQEAVIGTTAARGVDDTKKANGTVDLPNLRLAPNNSMDPASNGSPVDLLELSFPKRRDLSQGDAIHIFQATEYLCSLPRQLIRSISPTPGPLMMIGTNEIHLPVQVPTSDFLCLLNWLEAATMRPNVYPVRTHRDLASAIALYHAASALSMIKYIQPTLNYHKARIYTSVPTEEVVSMVEDSAKSTHGGYADENPFVSFVAERVAFLVRKGMVPVEDGQLEAYLNMISKYPVIHEAVQKINGPWNRRQEAKRAAEERALRIAAAKARHAKAKVEQKEAAKKRYTEDMEARAALMKKLGMQTKVFTLTRDELELMERLRGYGCLEISKLV